MPTPRVVHITQLAFGLNSLLDAGETLDPDEVRRRIQDESLLDWLDERYPEEMNAWMGLLRADPVDRLAVLGLFESLASAVNARRKFGVERNGIALLLAYCIEGIQQANPLGPSSGPLREL